MFSSLFDGNMQLAACGIGGWAHPNFVSSRKTHDDVRRVGRFRDDRSRPQRNYVEFYMNVVMHCFGCSTEDGMSRTRRTYTHKKDVDGMRGH